MVTRAAAQAHAPDRCSWTGTYYAVKMRMSFSSMSLPCGNLGMTLPSLLLGTFAQVRVSISCTSAEGGVSTDVVTCGAQRARPGESVYTMVKDCRGRREAALKGGRPRQV
eukprot:72567-Chlamydomonas_euryale.AAC.2